MKHSLTFFEGTLVRPHMHFIEGGVAPSEEERCKIHGKKGVNNESREGPQQRKKICVEKGSVSCIRRERERKASDFDVLANLDDLAAVQHHCLRLPRRQLAHISIDVDQQRPENKRIALRPDDVCVDDVPNVVV